ncbi:MAG: hypothetical protein QOD92_1041 [Acidimicrobiaceae bacterium]|jgi:hypothetical protein
MEHAANADLHRGAELVVDYLTTLCAGNVEFTSQMLALELTELISAVDKDPIDHAALLGGVISMALVAIYNLAGEIAQEHGTTRIGECRRALAPLE